jgi:hypothetical protein
MDFTVCDSAKLNCHHHYVFHNHDTSLKSSLPTTVDLKKSMGQWAVFIHWYSHPLPPHAHDHTKIPSTFCLTAWPIIINHRFPSSITPQVQYPSFPSYVCLLCFSTHETNVLNTIQPTHSKQGMAGLCPLYT